MQALPLEDFSVSLLKPLTFGSSAKDAYTKFSAKNGLGVNGRENFVNDLEWAVIEDYSELQKIKSRYPQAVMSGSGPTYYALDTEISSSEEFKDFLIINGLHAIPHGVKIVD